MWEDYYCDNRSYQKYWMGKKREVLFTSILILDEDAGII